MTDQATETTLSVSWEPVEADIDRYIVRYTSADGETREVPVSKEKSSTVLTGLRPGVEYKVDVWAQKGAQDSRKANTKSPTGMNIEVRGCDMFHGKPLVGGHLTFLLWPWKKPMIVKDQRGRLLSYLPHHLSMIFNTLVQIILNLIFSSSLSS